jgi:REP-associated tyrosine transposase
VHRRGLPPLCIAGPRPAAGHWRLNYHFRHATPRGSLRLPGHDYSARSISSRPVRSVVAAVIRRVVAGLRPAVVRTRADYHFVHATAAFAETPGPRLFGSAIVLFTACTDRRQPLLQIPAYRRIVADCGRSLPLHYPNVELDVFVIMPNHVHGIIHLLEVMPESDEAPAGLRPATTTNVVSKQSSLSQVVASLKSFSKREIRQLPGSAQVAVWQPTFHDRIVRGPRALVAVRRYIVDNPANWKADPFYPGDESWTDDCAWDAMLAADILIVSNDLEWS